MSPSASLQLPEVAVRALAMVPGPDSVGATALTGALLPTAVQTVATVWLALPWASLAVTTTRTY